MGEEYGENFLNFHFPNLLCPSIPLRELRQRVRKGITVTLHY